MRKTFRGDGTRSHRPARASVSEKALLRKETGKDRKWMFISIVLGEELRCGIPNTIGNDCLQGKRYIRKRPKYLKIKPIVRCITINNAKVKNDYTFQSPESLP